VFTLCACVHTQIWNGQAGGGAQQEACRWKLHQWREQGAGLLGCKGIFTLGHDLQTFRGEVQLSHMALIIYRILGSAWLWFSFFCSKKRQEDQWDSLQGLPLMLHSKPYTEGIKSHTALHVVMPFQCVRLFLLTVCDAETKKSSTAKWCFREKKWNWGAYFLYKFKLFSIFLRWKQEHKKWNLR